MPKYLLITLLLLSGGWCRDPYIITGFLLKDSLDSNFNQDEYPFDLKNFSLIGPDKIMSGVLYTRVKIDSTQYVMSRGSLNLSDLKSYKVFKSEDLKPHELVKMKFFEKNKSYPDEDLITVLINDRYIYTPDIPFLFYNNAGSWTKLYPEPNPPVQINVTSEPPGAEIRLGAKKAGITPLSYSLQGVNYLNVTFALDGYYQYEIPVQADTSLIIHQHAKLNKKISVYDSFSDTLNLREYADSNRVSLMTFYQRQDTLETRLPVIEKAANGLESRFDAVYPVLNKGLVAESSLEFNKRKKRYLDDKNQQLASLREEFRLKIIRYKKTLESIREYIFQREFIRMQDTLQFNSLKNFKQRKGKKGFVEFEVESGPWYFSYKGGVEPGFKLSEEPGYPLLEIRWWNLIVRSGSGEREYIVGSDSLYLITENKSFLLRGPVRYHNNVTRLPWYEKVSGKARLYSDSLRILRELERIQLKKQELERVQKIIRLKKAHRKKAIRWVSGLALTTAGAVLGVLAWQNSSDADTYYKKYPDDLTTGPANANRKKVQELDDRADLFSTLSGIGLTIGFLVLTF